MGVPQSGWFKTDNPFKMYELGYPPFEFRKAPNMAMFFRENADFTTGWHPEPWCFQEPLKHMRALGSSHHLIPFPSISSHQRNYKIAVPPSGSMTRHS